MSANQQQHPETVGFWELDEETGEVKDMGSYVNYPGDE